MTQTPHPPSFPIDREYAAQYERRQVQPVGHIVYFYTDPNTGRPIPCVVHAEDDGSYDIELITGECGLVTTGDLSCEDDSGRYLGGPRSF